MIKEEFSILLELNWSIDERQLIEDLEKNLNFYKKFLPNQTKEYIVNALKLSKKLKEENIVLKEEIDLLGKASDPLNIL